MSLLSQATLPCLIASVAGGAIGCRSDGRSTFIPTAAATRSSVIAHELSASYDFRGALGYRTALRIDSAHVAILDYPNNRVVVVDTTGAVVKAFGRKGGGPGEFLNPERLVRDDTTIFVYDGLKFALVGFDLRGDPVGDVSQADILGPVPPEARLTGMVALTDGSWVYSTSETRPDGLREALYRRDRGATHFLIGTLPALPQTLRLPCGISIQGGPPVFTPTLRWDAAGTRIAYATTGEDRVVVLDLAKRDSTLLVGAATPQRANREAALAVTTGYSVTTPTKRCELSADQVLEQRGMTQTMPVIDRLALSPSGDLWVRRAVVPGDSAITLVYRSTRVDSLLGGGFPGLFLTASRFLVESRDSDDAAVLSLWELRYPGNVR